MKQILIIIMLLLSLTVSAQRIVNEPFCAYKPGTSNRVGIEKIVLTKDSTKLFMFYQHPGGFNMGSAARIDAGGKRLTVISSEGIPLDGDYIFDGGADGKTHFVLNFPAVPENVETIDFVEFDAPNAFKIYDIALTDRAADEIKKRFIVPDDVKNFARNIQDNGQHLEQNEFMMGTAIVKGRIYGYNAKYFGNPEESEVTVQVDNPFTRGRYPVVSKIDGNGNYEIQVPTILKHQSVYLSLGRSWSQIMISAGKTVVVDFDIRDMSVYCSGDNADINLALTETPASMNYFVYDGEKAKEVAGMSASQYRDYIIDGYKDFAGRIDGYSYTARAKELWKINLKGSAAVLLANPVDVIQECYRRANNLGYDDPMTGFTRPSVSKEYLDYPKTLDLDNVNMFYAWNFSSAISGWNYLVESVAIYTHEYYAKTIESLIVTQKLSKTEKNTVKNLADKYRKGMEARTYNLTDEENAIYETYRDALDKYSIAQSTADKDAFIVSIFGGGDSYFKDFIKLQEGCRGLDRQGVAPESVVKEVEKMRNPFYAKYIKTKNAEINAILAAEKQRGGYYIHQASNKIGDALLEEITKDFKAKVVFIDFWNTWCGPCRAASKKMAPMEESFEGQDVVFIFIANESSPLNEWEGMTPSMKGHHYRLSYDQCNSLMDKWNFEAIPSYVIIGKDGAVKDFHTGFKGVDYYKTKIEEELKK